MIQQYDGQITVTQAVALSHYTRIHIYNLMKNGRLKHTRAKVLGIKICLIDKQSLLDYCKEQERPIDGNAS